MIKWRSLISGWSWARASSWLGLLLVAAYALGVDTLPIVTNDSLIYIDYSRGFGERGWVLGGYRQIGYPALLAIERWVSGVTGMEPLLFTALLQRLALVGSLAYAIWLWRWKALPVVVLVLTPEFLVFPNYVLTEGFTVPLSLLLACLLSHYISAVDRVSGERSLPRIVVGLAIVIGAVAATLLMVRFPLAVYGVIPVVAATYALIRFGGRARLAVWPAVGFLVIAVGFSFAVSVENGEEFGVFLPTTNGKNAEYWGAWRLTFGLKPANQDRQDLAEFYNEGTPHPLIAQIVDDYPDYGDRSEAFDDEIEGLLVATGTTRNRERAFSVMGALQGGRHDDLASYARTALSSDVREIDDVMLRNTYAIENGPQAFADRYNDGRLPEIVWTSSVLPRLPSPGLAVLLDYLLPLSLGGIVLLGLVKRRYLLALAFLIPTLAMSLAMGWVLLDNLRLLLPTATFSVAGLSALWWFPLWRREETAAQSDDTLARLREPNSVGRSS